jgi:hypothetical protein
VIVFSPRNGSGLFRVSASGGNANVASELDRAGGELEHGFPQFMPDGKHFIYHTRNSDPAKSGIVFRQLDQPAGTTSNRWVLHTDSRAVFVNRSKGEGALLYLIDSTLMAKGFEPTTGRLSGETLATPATGLPLQSSLAGFVPIAANPSGMLAFQTGAATNQLVWRDREGKAVKILGKASEYVCPSLSPDGQHILVSQSDSYAGKLQLWLIGVEPFRASRLTFGVRDFYPVWSADGKEVIFTSSAAGQPNLHRKIIDGGSEGVPLGPFHPNPQYPSDWSRNGEYVLYAGLDAVAASTLMVWPVSTGKPFTYLQSSSSQMHGQFSPDAGGTPKWIAYTSDESGIDQVYVQAFRGQPASGSKIQVTANGGRQPRWRGDGKELFFLAPDNKLMSVPVTATVSGLEFGSPVFLFDTHAQVNAPLRYSYDVTRDGKNFVLVTEDENPSSNRINVLVNWETGLRR